MTLVATDSSYEDYADNFDLSLLSMDNEFNSIIDSSSQSEYIPTTVFERWNINQQRDITNSLTSSTPQEHILVFPPSPTPSIELSTYNCNITKTEKSSANYNLYPPSPPDSNGAPSPINCQYMDIQMSDPTFSSQSDLFDGPKKDYQLLREHLQDLSFQKKHNLKPLPLESLFVDDWDVQDDIEPVISLALEQARKDVEQTCLTLNISSDPQEWNRDQVRAWLQFTMKQFEISSNKDMKNIFDEDGKELSRLNEIDFISRIPQAGSTLFAQLEIWKASGCNVSETSHQMQPASNQSSCMSPWNVLDSAGANTSFDWVSLPMETVEAEYEQKTISTEVQKSTIPETSPPQKSGRQGSAHIHLWQFLKELLQTPQTYGNAIRWLDRSRGVFKIEDSVRVARLWGRRKNRPAMNYDKLSRSIRQYYKKGIMKKTERSQRLVYQFCVPYSM
ncbi:DNA-binding protein D-ETS-4 isoform X2 [Contarinia nasturtii]|nr:DNA-binding protein D-ETS-4 isoform X2 [Contarinia nasturtii]